MESKGDRPVDEDQLPPTADEVAVIEHNTLKYHLLGPSLTKAGQDTVDQQKVRRECLYERRNRA